MQINLETWWTLNCRQISTPQWFCLSLGSMKQVHLLYAVRSSPWTSLPSIIYISTWRSFRFQLPNQFATKMVQRDIQYAPTLFPEKSGTSRQGGWRTDQQNPALEVIGRSARSVFHNRRWMVWFIRARNKIRMMELPVELPTLMFT